jgi:hypothetical protein
MYLNDLPHWLHQGAKPVIYADNISVLTARNDEELKIKINGALDQACQTCGPLQAHLQPAQRIL